MENSTYDLYTIPKDSDSQNPDGNCSELYTTVALFVLFYITFLFYMCVFKPVLNCDIYYEL